MISVIRILLVVPIAMALVRLQLRDCPVAIRARRRCRTPLMDFSPSASAGRANWARVLDPIADKLLLATVFVALSFLKLVPLWLMVAAVARDVIIVSGAAAYRILHRPLDRASLAHQQDQHAVSGRIYLGGGRPGRISVPAPTG